MIGETISHYRIVEKLGHGGMGVVYKAQDLKLDRLVALKFLPVHAKAEDESTPGSLRKRFEQEAKAASALDHANIGTIYEIDETKDGQIFIVMAYYEGDTLEKKIEAGPLQLDEVLDIAFQLATGVAKAHEKGIVHRDIKPANIIVTTDGVVKIIDFGLAKFEDVTRITARGSVIGTVAYMAPEQVRGDSIDVHADVWAMGVVVYEMLTGQRPFRGEHSGAVTHAILNSEPDPPQRLRKDIAPSVAALVDGMLHKDYSRRPNASAVADALSGRVIEGPPQATGGRKLTVAAAAVVLTLVAWYGVAVPAKRADFIGHRSASRDPAIGRCGGLRRSFRTGERDRRRLAQRRGARRDLAIDFGNRFGEDVATRGRRLQ